MNDDDLYEVLGVLFVIAASIIIGVFGYWAVAS